MATNHVLDDPRKFGPGLQKIFTTDTCILCHINNINAEFDYRFRGNACALANVLDNEERVETGNVNDLRGENRMLNANSLTDMPPQDRAFPADFDRNALAATERELIRRVLGGDTDAFHVLIRPYERVVFATVASILGNDADAEEAVQEAMLKAFKHLGGFRQESKFSTWLIQIAVNEARMKLRKDRRYLYESIEAGKKTEDGDYIPTDFADWRNIPSDALEKREVRDLLNQALQSLDEKYRTVLIMRDVDQMSIAETAQILGITEQNVKTRTSRARLRLRDLLAPAWASAQGTSNTNPVGTQ